MVNVLKFNSLCNTMIFFAVSHIEKLVQMHITLVL